jgi:murein DD-endopeptidase MepM/ murein hydrolase activator NlpD
VPRQHFPTSRRRRRIGIARASLLSAVVAAGLALALPATTPRGDVLDLVTDRVGPATAAGLEPTPVTAGDRVVPAAPADTAVATPFRDPRRSWLAGPVERAVVVARAGPPPVAGLTGYQWPIARPRITLPFGPTPWGTFVVDGERFHDGIDIATFCGDRVLAAHEGTVIAAGRHFDTLLGWVGHLDRYVARLNADHLWWELPLVVVVDDGNGYRSIYAHFGRLKVQRGDTVHAGQLLGYEGATGHATGCHLHYGLFSPAETRTYTLNKDTAKRMKLPRHERARIDPLRVFPKRPGNHTPDGNHPSDG